MALSLKSRATGATAIIKTEKGDEIRCQFNPAQLSLSRSTNWSFSEQKGKNAPATAFQAGQADSLSLKLTLDTTLDKTSVLEYTSKLEALMDVDDSLKTTDKKRNLSRPPTLTFHWGEFNSFKAVLTSLSLRFTYFGRDGIPLRAEADLTLKQFADKQSRKKTNPTSGTPGPATVHQVLQGETLDRIAAEYYGDYSRWREIAVANEIVDPLTVEPGTTLVIPSGEVPVG